MCFTPKRAAINGKPAAEPPPLEPPACVPDKSESWPCAQCTFLNPPSAIRCDMCCKARPSTRHRPQGPLERGLGVVSSSSESSSSSDDDSEDEDEDDEDDEEEEEERKRSAAVKRKRPAVEQSKDGQNG